jgi:ribosomal protein L7Ae-like RNA K-turn-binding protein
MRKGGKNSPVTVFEASDTSENTRKRISDKCTYYNIKHIKINIGGEELAAALGKSAYLAAVAVTDKEMSLMAERHI